MDSKILELTSMSGKGLKNVSFRGNLKPYVAAYLSDDPKNKQKTPVHYDAGTSPTWNHPMVFNIYRVQALQYLVLKIKHKRTLLADKDIGEVRVPLKELFDVVADAKNPDASLNATFPVSSSGKVQGKFMMAYRVVDNFKMGSYGPDWASFLKNTQSMGVVSTENSSHSEAQASYLQNPNIKMGLASAISRGVFAATTGQILDHLCDGAGAGDFEFSMPDIFEFLF